LTGNDASDSPRPWQPGDRITLRGRDWTVVRRTAYVDCEALRVDSVAGSSARTFLLPFDRPHRLEHGRLTVVSTHAWLRGLELLMLHACPIGGLQDCSDRIDLVPYQLEPALAMLRHGHARLLLADDVGMGKTIEAGLILRDLASRRDGFRALILVPAGLRQQWADELRARFSLESIPADSLWLHEISRSLPADINPWSPPGIYVASFDFVKRPEALRPLEDVRWDLLVVDEAHGATSATDRRAAIDAIASRALRLVLLTATPPVDQAEFASLCSIGHRPGEPDIVMFRRHSPTERRDQRRSLVLAARITEDERRMHRLLERYTTLVWREAEKRGHSQGRLASIVLRKRALSSPASLEASLRRRQELLAGTAPPAEVQMLLPLSDDAERDDLVPDDLLRVSGLSDPTSEQRWLAAVLGAASAAAGRETKARALLTLLRRIHEPVIVFTEYRDTLERLRDVLLQATIAVCTLHGGLTAAERRQALERFAHGDAVLLATDAAAEGLNLQRTSRVIVHYELPWNPSRMLQRAGRVDRIGQRRRVHEIALVAADTAEALVLAPLARRAAGWRRAGTQSRLLEILTESRLARAIFERTTPEVPEPGTDGIPTASIDLRAEAEMEVARLRGRRACVRAKTEGGSDAILVSTLRRSSLPSGIVLLFHLQVSTPHGDVVARHPVAVQVLIAKSTWSRRPAQIKRHLSELLPHVLAAVSPTIDELGRQHLASVQPLFNAAITRVRFRAQGMREARESAARQLVQIGLFDRRSVRAAAAQQQAAGSVLQEDREDEQQTIAGGARPALTAAACLRAVLVVSPRS
jgi:superfamily II DNA or RNA helicase